MRAHGQLEVPGALWASGGPQTLGNLGGPRMLGDPGALKVLQAPGWLLGASGALGSGPAGQHFLPSASAPGPAEFHSLVSEPYRRLLSPPPSFEEMGLLGQFAAKRDCVSSCEASQRARHRQMSGSLSFPGGGVVGPAKVD